MEKILIVDDEPNILTLLAYQLESSGYEVVQAEEGRQALNLALTGEFDLIVLDLMLPKLNGMEVCQRLRREEISSAILILSARGEEVDKVLALELGADDYMVKPFSPRELVARVKAILRRKQATSKPADNHLSFQGLELYPDRHEVFLEGQALSLTPKEFDLLHYLMANQGLTLSRDRLLEAVWGFNFAQESRLVDVHIGKLRDKLGDFSAIQTVRGFGYKFGGR